jgi:hypothetical protein
MKATLVRKSGHHAQGFCGNLVHGRGLEAILREMCRGCAIGLHVAIELLNRLFYSTGSFFEYSTLDLRGRVQDIITVWLFDAVGRDEGRKTLACGRACGALGTGTGAGAGAGVGTATLLILEERSAGKGYC